MDVFAVHQQVIDDYEAFTSGFVEVRDERIKTFVDQQLDDGVQWPAPWLSLNPSFATGGSTTDLVREGLLSAGCEQIFRRKSGPQDTGREPIVFHRHQREAIEAARSGSSYVLTTGTGSGKSLAYIVPIVDAVLRERERRGGARQRGVKAIVVYPMNALANSQVEELRKFLNFGFPEGGEPVTFARYTGQESQDERRRILADPPDILLTNYVMLELVLTRPDERKSLVRAAQGLRFLALDELHTYRGRQGADVAMLVRRLRQACSANDLQVVGTSATMASSGTIAERGAVVAEVATRLFGTEVTAERVVGETLARATTDAAATREQLARAVAACAPSPRRRLHAEFVDDPLAGWVETTFGLDHETRTGRLIRRTPTTLPDAVKKLAAETGTDEQECTRAVRHVLEEGSEVRAPAGRPVFAFRLHQFLSKGDTVHVSLEPEASRHVTDTYQVSVPGQPGKKLLPLAFCRECGQEYLVVAEVSRGGAKVFVPRRDADASGGDSVTGYLYVSTDLPWPHDPLVSGRLPEAWLTTDPATDDVEVLQSKRKYLPEAVGVLPDGTLVPPDRGLPAWFVSTPFAFCMRCGVSYEQVRGQDFGKLATLDAEGRSSAVSLVSASLVRALRAVPDGELPAGARKLLTFVDNRQDASLQAGHLNDFVQVTQLRAALCSAMAAAGPDGIGHEDLAARVTEALGMAPVDYAVEPRALSGARAETERALRAVVEYRLYVDLQRGWRVTMPNLEQTGLLRIGYRDLDELASSEEHWEGVDLLEQVSPEQRAELCRILLDELRRVRAIEVDCLTDVGFERLLNQSRQQLVDPWALPQGDRMVSVGVAVPRPARSGGSRDALALTGRGAFGRYLKGRAAGLPGAPTTDQASALIADMLRVLARAGLLAEESTADGPQYRLRAAAIRWCPGDGSAGAPDPLRRNLVGEERVRVNPFFHTLYRDLAAGFAGLHASEHTAQVPQEVRQQREKAFREGELPLLYCSPTMELGVDISDLNAVGLRNVPPTPANYAQRSGRAGRSGQPALVFTYCSSGNAHDSWWFRRSRDMVAGSVVAPRLDLGNEDLVRSHVHAVWLAETGESLGSSITDLVESEGVDASLRLRPTLWSALLDEPARRRAQSAAEEVLADLRRSWLGAEPPWWSPTWVRDQVEHAAQRLDAAFDRWRSLYRAALAEYHQNNELAINTRARQNDRRTAERRRAEARNQLSLLRNEHEGSGSGDFYVYRYLASEGFLPGYSFPRLPLAAYVSGTQGARGGRGDGDYLQRPRFVAISEFGPGSLIYHEGARYEVTRVQLPRDAGQSQGGGAITGTARRCEDCGYHHPEDVGTDVCEQCGAVLGAKQHGLMRLQTVFTRRRERISSDEEERRKSGYELEVSYRFADRGDRPSSTPARAVADGTDVLDLVHADAAEMRIANVGRRRRKNPADRGYWLDLREGRWLSDKAAKDATVDDDLPEVEEAKDRDKVVPFVDDRRSLLLVRLSEPVTDVAATTLRTALERAVEATFQLEDSELDSKALPDPDGRARMLLTESAEGGAGVLERLVTEPGALARVARTALDLVHYDPNTGEDRGKALGARERCELGCYDCLLSYANQYEHASIDRHAVVPLLRQLMGARVTAGAGGRDREQQREHLSSLVESGLEGRFVDWLDAGGFRLPDGAQRTVDAARARPDFVYDVDGTPLALFVDGPHHDDAHRAERDARATERLENLGWGVVRVRHDEDWDALVARERWLFGAGRTS